ncbi:MAG: DUF6951 family protein [Desulfobaccales bacterium]
MTRLIVEPGACGFTCKIEVQKVGKYQVSINVQSQCEQIKKLANGVTEIDFLEINRVPYGQNYISQSSARCKLHPSCPIPCGLIKAIEAELGMAVKKNVSFTYEE